MSDVSIVARNTVASPKDYVVPGAQEILPKAVRAVIDGTNAAGTFIPALQLIDPAGDVMWTALDRNLQLAPGVTTSVSWFPRVVGQTVSLGGPPGSGCVVFVGPPSGIDTVDTAAIQAAHDSLPSTGGTVQMCRGTYQLTAAGLTFSKPIQLAGHGRFVTELQYPFSTGNAITVTATLTFLLRDFSVKNTAGVTPTAGTGIIVTGNSSYWQMLGIAVLGFYTCINVTTSNSWTIGRTLVQDFVLVGIEIANSVNGDQGDFMLQDVHFFTGPTNVGATRALAWFSAGGLKMNGCKFNGPSPGNAAAWAMQFAIADGVTTGSMSFVNNSIENYGIGMVFIAGGSTHTGFIDRIAIAANEFVCSNTALNISPTVAGQYASVAITGNVMGYGTNGIVLGNVDNVTNGGNVFKAMSGANVVLNAGLTNHTTYANG